MPVFVLAFSLNLVFGIQPIHATEQLNIYLFWGNGCPHCAKEKEFLTNELIPNNPDVKLNSFEIYYNPDNVKLLQQVEEEINATVNAVPFLVVGDQAIVGYSEDISPAEIEDRVKYCLANTCPDSVAAIVNPDSQPPEETTNTNQTDQPDETADQSNMTDDQKSDDSNNNASDKKEKIINLPIIGDVNVLDYSLPLLTIFMGTLDGFNPCAMWTLLFLISLLLGMKDRKKMWLLGSAFIVASALVYFIFMAAWLNIILLLGFIVWVRYLIGLVALGGGGYSLKKYLTNKNGGCEVTGDEKRQQTFAKLREIVKHNSLWIALGGIVLLALAVNLVELICSAGLPAVYTQVLALGDLVAWQYYAYIALYIFFFMLDDLIIFFIAMTTLRMTGISTKYSRFSNLIGGLLMIAIGLILILKPEWLMFG